MKTNLLKLAAVFMVLMLSTSMYADKLLCLIGDATNGGWDRGNASPMIQDATNPAVFYYNAWLDAGNFKFILENNDGSFLPTWNKEDDTHIIKRTSSSDADNQFSIATSGNYSITVDTLNLTISISAMSETEKIPFNTVFITGDATPANWTITDAIQLTKSGTYPNEFTYSGHLYTGDFKFPVNRNSGWGQDFFMKVSDTEMVLQNSPDSKWTITEEGNYNITMNTKTLAISIVKQTSTGISSAEKESVSLKSSMVNNILQINNLHSFKYNVYNLSGIAILSGFSEDGNIDVASLQKGIYLLYVNNQSFKFIKQ